MNTEYLAHMLQQHALVISQSVAALAEIEAMKASNRMADSNGYTIPYGAENFRDVIGEYRLDYNSVVESIKM